MPGTDEGGPEMSQISAAVRAGQLGQAYCYFLGRSSGRRT